MYFFKTIRQLIKLYMFLFYRESVSLQPVKWQVLIYFSLNQMIF